MQSTKTRSILLFLLVLAFGVLIFGGYIIHKEKPPIPTGITTPEGEMIFTGEEIMNGQNFYFSRGGHRPVRRRAT